MNSGGLVLDEINMRRRAIQFPEKFIDFILPAVNPAIGVDIDGGLYHVHNFAVALTKDDVFEGFSGNVANIKIFITEEISTIINVAVAGNLR